MADLVMGAMGNLTPKLYELLKDEYKLQTGVKERISSLTHELEHAQAALHKVAQVPWDQLDEEVKLWSREVREASYDMEDILDTFLVRVQGPADSAEQEKSLLKPLKKMVKFIKTNPARRKVSGDVKDIMAHLQEVTDRCRRYKVHDIVAKPSTASTIDPRLHAMYNKVKDLVGMDKSRSELKSMLQLDHPSDTKMKIVSVVGVGGLGKTTLAKAVYDSLIIGDFDCGAFVPVGRNPDLKKILKDILIGLDRKRYIQFNTTELDERNLIDELRNFFLENKRSFVVIDDIWELKSWDIIKLAFDNEKSSGDRIIITTRYMEIATTADEVYELQPLPDDISRELLFKRIAGSEARYVDSQPDEITNKFIRKCGGIPLAIITMASLLAQKKGEDWYKLYESISFGDKGNTEAETTMRILSFSYYDLPSHLRTCLLYLSAFPEDSVIRKDSLVWKWVAEGFVRKEKEKRLFETGEGYFNDLINRSMIQGVIIPSQTHRSVIDDSIIYGCRVHDVVLDFIRDTSQEENFFTLWDNNNDEGRLDQRRIVRRLAHNSKTSLLANLNEMPSVRSVVVFSYNFETLVPICRFKLLRVLDIEFWCSSNNVHTEYLGQLLHLRFLRLSVSEIKKIPEEIGALKFLQTLDLGSTTIRELPTSRCLPKQLAFLRVLIYYDAPNVELFSVEGLTSLEELSIHGRYNIMAGRRLAKQLSSLTELRVLDATFGCDEETERVLVESLRHLNKLQHVEISCWDDRPLQGSEYVFHRPLRHLAVDSITFCKLPPCISPSHLPNLCHLDLYVEHVDSQDLKLLGKLPELYYLRLGLFCRSWETVTISNVTDRDAAGFGYFPKLRFCIVWCAMVFFVGNKDNKVISFHLWNGNGDIPLSCASGYDDLPMTFGLFDDEYIAMNSVVPDDQSKGSSICTKSTEAAHPPFMPRLEVLHFSACGESLPDHRYFGNLGLEYLSSLREIKVEFEHDHYVSWGHSYIDEDQVKAMLEHAAQVHPNRPTLSLDVVVMT